MPIHRVWIEITNDGDHLVCKEEIEFHNDEMKIQVTKKNIDYNVEDIIERKEKCF